MRNIIYGQDGESVNQLQRDCITIEKGDTKYIKDERREVYDFVGFILNDKNILSIFPKHYFLESEISDFNLKKLDKEADIKLLFEVILKYINAEKTSTNASKYIGNNIDYVSDYPFAAFFGIYNYYRRYGIYQENEINIKPGTYGKVSWKDTIQKSQKLISGGNIIFSPLYVKNKNKQHVFLSDCMAFIIDYTIEKFPYFLSFPRTKHKKSKFDYLANLDFVIKQLYAIKPLLFKDIHRELIDNIINFFEEYSKSSNGGAIHIKINYFNKIWERMVEKYLNDFFVGVDEVNDKLLFDKRITKSLVTFNRKTFCIDDSPHKYKIEPDHYGVSDNIQYIFDSKYYYNVSNLNYKQFSYNELLSPIIGCGSKTYSALILPGNESKSSLHLSLNSAFVGGKTSCTKIIEQYLDIKEIMINYVRSY